MYIIMCNWFIIVVVDNMCGVEIGCIVMGLLLLLVYWVILKKNVDGSIVLCLFLFVLLFMVVISNCCWVCFIVVISSWCFLVSNGVCIEVFFVILLSLFSSCWVLSILLCGIVLGYKLFCRLVIIIRFYLCFSVVCVLRIMICFVGVVGLGCIIGSCSVVMCLMSLCRDVFEVWDM